MTCVARTGTKPEPIGSPVEIAARPGSTRQARWPAGLKRRFSAQRLQQSSPIDFRRHNDLFDFRYAPGVRTTLSSSGALMYDSLDPEYWHSPWPYLAGLAILGGGLCLAETVICEDDGDGDGEGSDYTPPGS